MPSTTEITRYQQTLDDAYAYADYQETGDASRAAKFVTAVNRLLFIIADSAERSGGETYRFDKSVWLKRLASAQQFVAAKSNAGGGFRYYKTGADGYR